MKIAVATDHGKVSQHFGRCAEYTVFDVESGAVITKEVVPNPGHQPGFLPRFLSEQGVHCIMTGGMGQRAKQLFEERKIETISGVDGDVDDVVKQYLAGELENEGTYCEH